MLETVSFEILNIRISNLLRISCFVLLILKLLLYEGRKSSPSIIGRMCTFGTKIGEFYEDRIELSAYVEMNKKIFKNFDFCFLLIAFLADFYAETYCLF